MNSPLSPKIVGAMSRILNKSMVRDCCCGLNSGARIWLTIQGANRAESKQTVDRTSRRILAIDEVRYQAFLRSPFARKSVTVGTKAEASAPPAIRLKRMSGKVEAALYASMTSCVPNALDTRIWRTRPTRLLNTKAAITVLAARAIWRFAEVGWLFTQLDYILRDKNSNKRLT